RPPPRTTAYVPAPLYGGSRSPRVNPTLGIAGTMRSGGRRAAVLLGVLVTAALMALPTGGLAGAAFRPALSPPTGVRDFVGVPWAPGGQGGPLAGGAGGAGPHWTNISSGLSVAPQ